MAGGAIRVELLEHDPGSGRESQDSIFEQFYELLSLNIWDFADVIVILDGQSLARHAHSTRSSVQHAPTNSSG